MTLTNFPNGISSFGVPIYGTQVPVTGGPPTGNVFFVQSTNGQDAGPGNSPQFPYKTLTYTLTQVLANNGDVIYLMPGSTFNVSDATSYAITKAGVSIVGLGNGNARPTITLDTGNTSTFAVSAANVAFINCIFIANFLSIAACFTLSTAKGFTLINCEFRETSNVLDFLNIIKSTGAANTVDNLYVQGNVWNGLGTTSVNSFILTANDINDAEIYNNTVILARTATAPILMTVTAGVLTNLNCVGNNVSSLQTATTTGALIGVSGTTGTGMIAYNFAGTLQATAASDLLVTAGHKFAFVQNFTAGAADKSGILVPAAFS